MVNKFRLVIDGKFIFYLTKANYQKVLGNPSIEIRVKNILTEMESSGVDSILNQYDTLYSLQVNKR